jgi:hypothetical protein
MIGPGVYIAPSDRSICVEEIRTRMASANGGGIQQDSRIHGEEL